MSERANVPADRQARTNAERLRRETLEDEGYGEAWHWAPAFLAEVADELDGLSAALAEAERERGRLAEALRAHEIAMRQIREERRTGYLLQRLDAILAEYDAALAVVCVPPAPGAFCECGHIRGYHDLGERWCLGRIDTIAPLGGGSSYQCSCRAFVAASSVSPEGAT